MIKNMRTTNWYFFIEILLFFDNKPAYLQKFSHKHRITTDTKNQNIRY